MAKKTMVEKQVENHGTRNFVGATWGTAIGVAIFGGPLLVAGFLGLLGLMKLLAKGTSAAASKSSTLANPEQKEQILKNKRLSLDIAKAEEELQAQKAETLTAKARAVEGMIKSSLRAGFDLKAIFGDEMEKSIKGLDLDGQELGYEKLERAGHRAIEDNATKSQKFDFIMLSGIMDKLMNSGQQPAFPRFNAELSANGNGRNQRSVDDSNIHYGRDNNGSQFAHRSGNMFRDAFNDAQKGR